MMGHSNAAAVAAAHPTQTPPPFPFPALHCDLHIQDVNKATHAAGCVWLLAVACRTMQLHNEVVTCTCNRGPFFGVCCHFVAQLQVEQQPQWQRYLKQWSAAFSRHSRQLACKLFCCIVALFRSVSLSLSLALCLSLLQSLPHSFLLYISLRIRLTYPYSIFCRVCS